MDTLNPSSSSFYFDQSQLPSALQMQQVQHMVTPDSTFAERLFPSSREAATSVREISSSLNQLTPQLEETMSAFRDSAESISEAASHFNSLIDNVKAMLTAMPLVKPFLSKILDALTILYDVIMAFINKIFYTIPTLIVRLFQLFGLDTVLINSFVKQVIHTQVSMQTEQGLRTAEVQGLEITNLFTESIGMLITGRKPDFNQIKYVNELLRYKTSLTGLVKDSGSVILFLVQSIPDQIKYWMSYVMPTKWWLNLFAPGTVYYTWIDAVNSLDEHEYTVRAAYEHLIQEKITNLYKVGQQLLKECTDSGPRVPQVYRLLESTFKKIDSLYKIVDMSAMSSTSRKIPFVIYLFGATGQGKSFISTILPAILANCPHDAPNLSYARSPDVDHWDGYTGQFAVQYDDFGAVSSSNSKTTDVSELMRIVSNDQMRLSMASLEDKGEVFRSKVVILSSNMSFIKPNELRDHTALWRRRHAFYEVLVKPEFRQPGRPDVDVTKIPDDYSHWRFFELDALDCAGTRRKAFSYTQFIQDIRRKYIVHYQQQERAIMNYEQMIRVANGGEEVSTVDIVEENEFYDSLEHEQSGCLDRRCRTDICPFVKAKRAEEQPVYTRKNTNVLTPMTGREFRDAIAIRSAELEGLADDYARMTNHQLETPNQMGDYCEFYRKLQEIDREAEKPAWFAALEQALPVAGVVISSMALIYGIYKGATWMRQKNENEPILTNIKEKIGRLGALLKQKLWRKAQNIQEYKVGEKVKGQIMVDIDTGKRWIRLYFPDSEEVGEWQLVAEDENFETIPTAESEGRWARMYERIKGASPWMVKIFDEGMENCEDFAGLTDEEVEKTIDRVLKDPKVMKTLETEGVYNAHAFDKHRGGNNAKPHITPSTAFKQGCIDENAMQVTTNRIAPHTALVIMDGRYSMVGLMVTGRIILVPYHFFLDPEGEMFMENTPMTILLGYNKYQMLFRPNKIKRIAYDAVLYETDTVVPNFRDTVKFFITNEDIQKEKPFEALLAATNSEATPLLIRMDGPVHQNVEDWRYTFDLKKEKNFFHGDGNWEKSEKDHIYTKGTCWVYNVQSRKGMCGSAIIKLDKMAARKVAGIHIAGTRTGDALGVIVTQEMLKEGLRFFEIAVQPAAELQFNDSETTLELQGNFTKQGKLAKTIFVNEKTKIVPSITHGLIYPIKTLPAVLRKNDIRAFKASISSPMKAGIEKYGNVAPLVNTEVLKEVEDHVYNIFSGLKVFCPKGILTEKEALNGVPGDDFIIKMDMTTSSGFPWNQQEGVKGKFPYIQLVNDSFQVVDPELRKKLDHRWQRAFIGEMVESRWIDSLKDERRTIEKVLTGKTRVFTIPPVDFTIVCRRLFGAFNSCFYNNKNKYFSAVGIDPMSLEWTLMYRKLTTNSDIGFAGDYSGWDGNLNPQFMMAICNIMNRWYGDSDLNQLARRVIFEEIIHTPQAALDLLYQTHIGNPSGNPLTVIINTIYNAMQKRYVWLLVAPPQHRCLTHFENNVCDRNYGDDDIVSVKREVLTFFNPVTISASLIHLNMKYTSADKGGSAQVQPIYELTFLKRGFRKNERGLMLPTIAMDTITELTNWTRECAEMTVEEASVDNLNDSLSFMFAYGKEAFDEHYKKIMAVLPTKHWQKLRSYRYYYQLFMSKTSERTAEVQGGADETGASATTESKTPVVTTAEQPPEENKAGTSMQTQSAIEISASTMEPKVAHLLQMACIREPEWDYKMAYNRKVWVQNFSWMASQGIGTILVSLNLPQDAIVNYLQSMLFERFWSCRPSMIFTVEPVSMKQQYGRLKLFSTPFTKAGITSQWQCINPATYYGRLASPIDATSSTVAKYIVPYSNPKTYISINGPSEDTYQDFTGTLNVVVQIPLTCPAGAPTSVDVALFVEFGEDTEFKVPLNSSASGYAFNRQHQQQLERRFTAELQGGQISNTFNNYGTMDGNTIPQHLTNDDFTGAASGNDVKASLDRAARTWNPLNVVRKYIQNYTNSIGSELVTRLDLDPSNMHMSTQEHFGTHIDEMKMEWLLCQPTPFAKISWPAAATRETVLYSGFIGPMHELFTQSTTNQKILTAGVQIPMTQFSYNAMHFAKWKGPQVIMLEIVGNAFTRGTFMFGLNWGAPPGTASTMRDLTSQYFRSFQFDSDHHTFYIGIPYVSQRPWMDMCRGPSSPDDPSVAAAWWETHFLGSWTLMVQGALQTLQGSPTDVEIIMSWSGAPGFEVYYPSNINQTFTGTIISDEVVPRTAEMQGDGAQAGGDTARATALTILPTIQWLGPPGSQPTIIGAHFGAKAGVKSVRDLIRRYHPLIIDNSLTYIPQTYDGTSDTSHGFTNLYNLTTPGTNDALPCVAFWVFEEKPFFSTSHALASNNYQPASFANPLTHFGLQYRYWGGATRKKVIFGDLVPTNAVKLVQGQSRITYIPHPQFTDGGTPKAVRPNWAALVADLAISGSYDTADASALEITSATGNNYSTDIARVDGNINYCEIEVPYTSILNSLATAQGILAGQVAPGYVNNGVTIITQTFFVPAPAASLVTSIITAGTQVLQSVGDDFRFGTFLGVPNVFPIFYNTTVGTTWPDTWVVTAAPEDEGVVSRTSTTSFEEVEPEQMTKSVLVRKLNEQRMASFLLKKNTAQIQGGIVSAQTEIYTNIKTPSYWAIESNTYLPKTAGFPVHAVENPLGLDIQQQEYCDQILVYMQSHKYNMKIKDIFSNMRLKFGLNIITSTTIHMVSTDETGDANCGTLNLAYQIPRTGVAGEVEYNIIMRKERAFLEMEEIDIELFTSVYARVMVRSKRFQVMMIDTFKTRDDYLKITGGVGKMDEEEERKLDEARAKNQLCFKDDTMEQIDMIFSDIKTAEIQGDHVSISNPPTTPNIVTILTVLVQRYETEEYFNARMALHQFSQQIDTVRLEEQIEIIGEPLFKCTKKLTVDNPIFSPIIGNGTAKRKRDAEEIASVRILEILQERVPDAMLPTATAPKPPKQDELVTNPTARIFYNREPVLPLGADSISKQAVVYALKTCRCRDLEQSVEVLYTTLRSDRTDYFYHFYPLINGVLDFFGFKLQVDSFSERDIVFGLTKIMWTFVENGHKQRIFNMKTYGSPEEGESFIASKERLLNQSFRGILWQFVLELNPTALAFESDDFVDME